MIPIRTDNPLQRTPLVNYALVFANIVIFIMTKQYVGSSHLPDNPLYGYRLLSDAPQLHQFISYAFLHGGWGHLLGNMLFLFIFGNNVNDRLGNMGYLLLYLAGAIFSGLGHIMVADAPVLGASGAVAAVTGAYMVLFPLTNIEVIYIFIFIGVTNIPAIYFILFKLIVWDNVIGPSFSGPANIAYSAHLAGYAFGVVVPLALLALKLLPHSHFDLWALAQRWGRRQRYRSAVSGNYNPFSPTGSVRKNVSAKVTDEAPPADPRVTETRNKISEAVYAGDVPRAAQEYLGLLALDPQQILPQQQQLDIANQLMHDNHHGQAAVAYELFLKHYQRYPFREQVQLMLGLLYSRYLENPQQARTHLTAALPRLSDTNQHRMCQDEIDRLC